MDEVNLTKAQLERLLNVGQAIVILNTNTDAGLIYYERTKYRGHTGEGKWIDRAGRERKQTA